jgi:hypothetical protein
MKIRETVRPNAFGGSSCLFLEAVEDLPVRIVTRLRESGVDPYWDDEAQNFVSAHSDEAKRLLMKAFRKRGIALEDTAPMFLNPSGTEAVYEMAFVHVDIPQRQGEIAADV